VGGRRARGIDGRVREGQARTSPANQVMPKDSSLVPAADEILLACPPRPFAPTSMNTAAAPPKVASSTPIMSCIRSSRPSQRLCLCHQIPGTANVEMTLQL
jgi:hypothetical protein